MNYDTVYNEVMSELTRDDWDFIMDSTGPAVLPYGFHSVTTISCPPPKPKRKVPMFGFGIAAGIIIGYVWGYLVAYSADK